MSPTSSDPYAVDPDLGHADLGAPSAPSGGGPGGGGAIADAGRAGESGPTGMASATSSSAPGLSGRSFSGSTTGRESPDWRSEAQALASRTRALSRELRRLDRSRGPASSNAASEQDRTDGTAATASTGSGPSASSGPGTPDSPPQVPLGGTEWLAAAGTAYALNRLRKDDTEEGNEA
ncbi:MAG: hypothetical protein ABEL51_10000 [Salinibacter sp.]